MHSIYAIFGMNLISRRAPQATNLTAFIEKTVELPLLFMKFPDFD